MAAETAESIFEKKVPIEGLKGHFGISAPWASRLEHEQDSEQDTCA